MLTALVVALGSSVALAEPTPADPAPVVAASPAPTSASDGAADGEAPVEPADPAPVVAASPAPTASDEVADGEVPVEPAGSGPSPFAETVTAASPEPGSRSPARERAELIGEPVEASPLDRAPLGRDPSPPERAPRDEPRRRGALLTLGTGLTHCPQDFCAAIPMGGVARLELGYRLGAIAVVGTVTGGGGIGDASEGGPTSVRFLDAGAGLLVLPVRQGPVDPFIGASLGYARSVRVFSSEDTTDRQFDSRAAVRISGGILWSVARRVALGPRVDVRLPFAGRWCTRLSDDPEDQCESIRDEILDDLEEGPPRRAQRRAFARPWTVTLDLRVTL